MRSTVHYRLTAFLLLGVIVLVSCSPSEVSMPEFRSCKPFVGRVVKVEDIGYTSDYHPRSISGPDFRLTLTREDGSSIIIKRIHTTLGSADRLSQLQAKTKCDLPDDIVQCEDQGAKNSY
jgi:hypothetical protein